jgi:hypothetical protein
LSAITVPQQDRVRALLECMPIKRVISVDDRHTPGLDVVINLARKLSGQQRAALLGLPDEAEAFDQREFFEPRLEAMWDELQPENQTELVQRAQRMAGQSEVADDTEALRQLAELIPDGVFETLSMAEWRDQRDSVIAGSDAVLVLFDRDFSAEGGREDEGETLLAELQEASEGKPIWAGLLTHTVTAQEEHKTYLGLAEYVDLHRTVVISKARIKDGSLAAHLRLTLLAPLLRRLVEIVADKLNETHEAAIGETLNVLPVELESMVFGASQVEGVWEVDTLLLLFGLIARDRARESVWKESEVHDLTAKVRCLARVDIGTPVGDRRSAEAQRAQEHEREAAAEVPRFYQSRQIYEDGDVINRLHLPIECGDIFEDSVRTSKKWIVIAQPCDLMVRSDGRRGEYPITHVAMAPVERERQPRDVQEGDFRLSYFDSKGRPYLVKLGRARYQRIWLLDFAVFREDGRALLTLGDDPIENMLTGWGARHSRLIERTREILQLCIDNDSVLARALDSRPEKSDVAPLAASVCDAIVSDHARPPFTATVDTDARSIDAGCRRIRRLSADYARALLARWGSHVARPVLPYDLTRGSRLDD